MHLSISLQLLFLGEYTASYYQVYFAPSRVPVVAGISWIWRIASGQRWWGVYGASFSVINKNRKCLTFRFEWDIISYLFKFIPCHAYCLLTVLLPNWKHLSVPHLVRRPLPILFPWRISQDFLHQFNQIWSMITFMLVTLYAFILLHFYS